MLITERDAVLAVYAGAAERGWVVPCFCAENPTTIEAILAAVREHGERIGVADPPVTLAMTVNYPARQQARRYTRTGRWDLGLRLFLADLRELAGPASPFARLRVLVHLDHVQPREDADLLSGDLSAFSSIMFDASHETFDENIRLTRRFVGERRREIVIEGACDEIFSAGAPANELTSPEKAARFAEETGADFLVANLGTEHRAGAAERAYRGDAARAVRNAVGPRLVLHGCSSVPPDRVARLFDDGIRKVNLWTALERDSTPLLFERMLREAARLVGPRKAEEFRAAGLLGEAADRTSAAALERFTAAWRQEVVFDAMKEIAGRYVRLWFAPADGTVNP